MHHFMDCLILTFKTIFTSPFCLSSHSCQMRGSHPFLPWDVSCICCCCAVAHHHYVHFTAHLSLPVYLYVVQPLISPLGFCTGIDVVQIPSHRSLGPHCRDNDGENNKGRGSKIKESMPPLPGQTPRYKNKHKKKGQQVGNDRSVPWMEPSQAWVLMWKTVLWVTNGSSEIRGCGWYHRMSHEKGAVGFLHVGATLMSGLAKMESNESVKAKANLKLEG